MPMEDLLTEWHTGRDASGEESPRLGHRWRSTKTPLGMARSYYPHIGDLGAMLKQPNAYTRVRIAVGVDGQDDVRIEVQATGKVAPTELRLVQAHPHFPARVLASDPRTISPDELGAITVTRWRPQSGDLDRVTEHHGAPRSARPRASVLEALAARADDATVATDARDLLLAKKTALRAWRAHLLELRQAHDDAGSVDVEVDIINEKLADVEPKILVISAEHDARKAVERAARAVFDEGRAAILAIDPDAKVELVDGRVVKVDSEVTSGR